MSFVVDFSQGSSYKKLSRLTLKELQILKDGEEKQFLIIIFSQKRSKESNRILA